MVKKIWADPVWAAVIATTISTVVGGAWTYFSGQWPSIGAAIVGAWRFMGASTNTPNWALALLGIPALLAFLLVLLVAYSFIRTQKDEPANWTNYTTDIFYGLVWRWNFQYGRIEDLTTYCPHCDFQVFPRGSSSFHSINRIEFACDSCHSHLGEHNESLVELQSKVQRFIQQKVRKNSWGNNNAAKAA